jgi:hypothetical protein
VRDFDEDAREAMHRRATSDPAWMKHRREMAEHPFGTMKWLMAQPRFLVRGLRKAKAELALGVLSYNLKRVVNILGVPALLQALDPAPSLREIFVSLQNNALAISQKIPDFSHSLLRPDDNVTIL